MLNTENLVKVQTKVVNEWLQTSQGSKKYPRFYQKSQGHFDYVDILIPSFNPHFDVLSPDLKEEIKLIASELNKNKGEKFQIEKSESGPSIVIGNSMIEGIIFGCYEAFLRTHLDLESSEDSLSKFSVYAAQFATQILEWNKSSGSRQFLTVVISPPINLGDYKVLDDWAEHSLNWIEASREAHVHGQSGQEGLMRIMNNTWLKRDISNFTGTEEDLVREAEQLILALSLALKQPFRIEDMRIEPSPWMFAPDRSNYFWLRFQPIWTSPVESLSIRFWGTVTGSTKRAPDALLSESDYNRVNKWGDILQANPASIFALMLIQQGLWAIYKSFREVPFRRTSTALNGMFNVLCGMEGLIAECVPQYRQEDDTFVKRFLSWYSEIVKGEKGESLTKTFIDCWVALWNKRLNNSTNLCLTRSKNIKKAVDRLYNVRSKIAHSDAQELPKALREAKRAMGDFVNPDIYDAPNTAMCLAFICVELMEVFHDEPSILTKLMRGEKP
jgi:hypothetical protein